MNRVLQSTLLRHLAHFTGTMTVMFGLTWMIAKPHAEDFVKRTLKPEILELTEAVESLGAVQQARRLENDSWQARTDTKIENIEKFSKEQRDTLNRILFEIRR